MSLKVFLLALACLSPLITHIKARRSISTSQAATTQIKAECLIRTSRDATIKPKFFRNYENATTLITNVTQGIRLASGEKIIGHCKTGFENTDSLQYDITIYCQYQQTYIEVPDVYYYHQINKSPISIFECKPKNDVSIGECIIEFPANRTARPKLFKTIGSRTLQVRAESKTTIQYDQQLIAQCETKFKSPNHQSTELNLICLNGEIIALGTPYKTKHRHFECESLKWNFYESLKPFPWCPSFMASYLLARPSAKVGVYEYLAGICYDLKQMSLKSLYHAAETNLENYLSPKILESFEPNDELTDIEEHFISTKTYSYENAQIQNWFSFSNFKKRSIIQNPKMFFESFQPFIQLLNIDLWSGLQGGNWQFYEETLATHVKNYSNEYNILAGVSGAVAFPIHKENCSKNNFTMNEVVDTKNNKLPLYVWNYLKSLRNSSNDVVVIGVNTPFADFYDEKELIFCEDICHNINWLGNARLTFRFRPLGVIFCCNVDDVVTSGRLDGFAVPTDPMVTSTSLPVSNFGDLVGDKTTVATVETGYDNFTEREQEDNEQGNLY